LAFGDFGLKAVGRGWMSAREIERRASLDAVSQTRRQGFGFGFFLTSRLTKKPLETRMEKEKELPRCVAVVQPGRILFEMEGVEGPLAKEAFRLAAHKLSIPTITVQRRSVAHGS